MDFSLFALRENPYFEAGTLVDLADSGLLYLPDRGDGEPASIERRKAVLCPPLAINIPPGQCPVKVTSITLPGLAAGDIEIEQTIQNQQLIVPVGSFELTEVVVRDRRRETDIDEYVSPRITAAGNYEVYIQHLGPGFYETVFKSDDGRVGSLTFIKLYPPYIVEGFAYLLENEEAGSKADVAFEKESSSPKPIRQYGEFTAELLNTALELVTEWGENYQKPIDERILCLYPDITTDDIAALTEISREAEYYIYGLAEKELNGELSESEIALEGKRKHSWINDKNLYRLKNIGMFYARK